MIEIRHKKVLFVSATRLGDTLFMTPAFRVIKQCSPTTVIHVIALTSLAAEVLRDNLYIDRVFIQPNLNELLAEGLSYDVSIDLHPSVEATMYFSGLKVPTVISVPVDNKIHMGERAIQAAAKFIEIDSEGLEKGYDLFLQEEDDSRVVEKLKKYSVDFAQHTFIGIHLGCHGLAKKHTNFFKKYRHKKAWPLKKFIRLGKLLVKQYPNVRIILTGSKEEMTLAEEFMRAVPGTINLVDATSVLELAALMRCLKLYICSDTGAIHVASAMNVPLVGLYNNPNKVKRNWWFLKNRQGEQPMFSPTMPWPSADYRTVLSESCLRNLKVKTVLQSAIHLYSKY